MATKMRNTDITEITVGTAVLAVESNGQRAGGAASLRVVYAGTDSNANEADFARPITDMQYPSELVIGGIPLSLTVYYDSSFNDASPNSTDVIGTYYALDIIKIAEDPDPNNAIDDNINFTLNGNILATTKIRNRHYVSIIESSNTIDPSKQIYFKGMPMATNRFNELLVNDTGYGMGDLNDTVEVMIGGIPLQVGRLNFRYYLIVKVMGQASSSSSSQSSSSSSSQSSSSSSQSSSSSSTSSSSSQSSSSSS